MITANGARITEVETNKILGNIYCPIRKQKKALEMVQNTSLYRIYIIRGEGYVSEKQYWEIEEYYQDPKICQYLRATRKRVPDLIAFWKKKDVNSIKWKFYLREKKKRTSMAGTEDYKRIRLLSLPQFNNIEVNDMENAVKEVKAASDYVTDSNEEEGRLKQ